MRFLAATCFVLSLLLLGARFCTGLVHGEDSPVTYLVWKAPSWNFSRQAKPDEPVNKHFLDSEEPELVYERPYKSVMRAAPVLIVVFLVVGFTLSIADAKRLERTSA